jgi:hypothetical protein
MPQIIIPACGLYKSPPVIPAKAGIQCTSLDSHLRGNDDAAFRKTFIVCCDLLVMVISGHPDSFKVFWTFHPFQHQAHEEHEGTQDLLSI